MADEKSKEVAPESTEQADPITIGESEFESQEKLVESYQKLLSEKQNLEKLYGRQSNELGGLRKQASVTPSKHPDAYAAYGDQLIDEPGQVLEKVAGSLKEEIMEELALRESQKKSEDAYWDKFFSANETLGAHRDRIVNDAYTRLWPELEGKSFEDQAKRIATEWSFVGESKLSDEPSGSEAPSGLSKPVSQSSENQAAPDEEPKKFGDMMQDRFDNLYKE